MSAKILTSIPVARCRSHCNSQMESVKPSSLCSTCSTETVVTQRDWGFNAQTKDQLNSESRLAGHVGDSDWSWVRIFFFFQNIFFALSWKQGSFVAPIDCSSMGRKTSQVRASRSRHGTVSQDESQMSCGQVVVKS